MGGRGKRREGGGKGRREGGGIEGGGKGGREGGTRELPSNLSKQEAVSVQDVVAALSQ